MPEDKPTPGARRVAAATTTETETAALEVTALEERVLRAHRGATVPEARPLPQKDDGLPEAIAAELRRIEEAAFRRADRLGELRADLERAEAEEAERDARRAKIVARLRGAASPVAKPEGT